MIDNSVDVAVSWNKPEPLPTSGEYSTVIKFPCDGERESEEYWRILIKFFPLVQSADAPEWFGTATFLSPDGPWERLSPNSNFQIIEGWKTVANVRVLPSVHQSS